MNLYHILQIDKNANINEIRKAYHKMLLKYHPDKNHSDDAREKLEEVKLAYEILSNKETRKKYSMLSEDKSSKLWWILQGWIRKISSNDLTVLLSETAFTNIKEFFNIFDNLTMSDILSWFNKPHILPKVDKEELVGSETDTWNLDNCYKLYDMPIKFLTENPGDIHLILNCHLTQVINNDVRKLKINRNINEITKNNNFIIPLNYPFVIFPNAGDIIDNNCGNLIFFINIDGWVWEGKSLIYEKHITLYQMLYGLDIKLNLGKEEINYKNYIPHRDGWEILLSQKNNIKFKIKLILEDLNEDKKQLLYSYFN